ncbi:hypothetical protein ACLB2K_061208 [Fragaria x ananassa]
MDSLVLLLGFLLLTLFSQRFSLPVVVALDLKNSTRYNKQVSTLRLERIEKRLNKINKPPVMTIQSPDGDIIDCVHKRKQPALDHPLLKNHKIQKVAPERPKVMKTMKPSSESENDTVKAKTGGIAWGHQMWHTNGTRCPRGTVPIRRTTVSDVLRAKSLFDYGKKSQRRTNVNVNRQADAPDVASGNGHEHAIAYTGSSNEVYGAKATINVWTPAIEQMNEFSLSQIWVLSGSFDGTDLNSIEAGWQVSPELYGDSRPRLFTYWTTDSYQATGCYNLLCSGFVQTNSRIAIGASISPVSSYASEQFDVTILIWKVHTQFILLNSKSAHDPKLGNWWMGYGENNLVGYWPAELFTHLADRATMVEWGGEVVNTRSTGEHTSTQMGSGHFAEDGFGKASYFRNLEIVDSDNSLSSVREVSTLAENTNCYNIKSSYNNDWGTYFYYGGPGRNPKCQ